MQLDIAFFSSITSDKGWLDNGRTGGIVKGDL